MKIVLQDHNKLIIKNGSYHWLIGSILLIAGLFIIFKPALLNINTEIPWWLGLFIVVCGIVPIIFSTRDLISFNKVENKLKISQKNFLKEKNYVYELGTIKSIELWTLSNQNGGNRNNSLQYKLACILENGQHVILNPDTSSSTNMSVGLITWNIIPEKGIGEKIAAFLNIPFVENRRPPTVTETLNVLYEGVQDAIEKHSNQQKLK
ncbi:MAG: hypothetical protein EBV82_08765 [Chitinophagia bacterium]|nr:hypothetical protein [Chitinophagia bacterium]